MRAAALFSAAGLAGSAIAAPVLGNLPVVGNAGNAAGDVVGKVNQLTVPVVELLQKVETVTDGVGAGNVVDTVKAALKGITAKIPIAGGLGDVVLGDDGIPIDSLLNTVDGVVGGLPIVGGLVSGLPLGTVGDVVNGVTDKVPIVNDILRRDSELENVGSLVNLLQITIKGVQEHTGALNSTIALVQAGKMTKEEAQTAIIPDVTDIHFKLTTIVTKVTGAAGLPVADGQVDEVLSLVVSLVSELLATVKSTVTVLGLTPQLTSLLRSVFTLVANLLTVVIGLLGAVLPGLLATLNPLLAGLGNGLLAPLLTPVTGLLSGLNLPIAV